LLDNELCAGYNTWPLGTKHTVDTRRGTILYMALPKYKKYFSGRKISLFGCESFAGRETSEQRQVGLELKYRYKDRVGRDKGQVQGLHGFRERQGYRDKEGAGARGQELRNRNC
jgi:hypothetical protein